MEFGERDFGPIDPEDAEEERRNFLTVMAAFKYYRLIQLIKFFSLFGSCKIILFLFSM